MPNCLLVITQRDSLSTMIKRHLTGVVGDVPPDRIYIYVDTASYSPGFACFQHEMPGQVDPQSFENANHYFG